MTGIIKFRLLFLIFLLISFVQAVSQEAPTWDNQLYLGNKVAFGKNKWKYSGELQIRLENNFQSLDNWYLEFVSNYLISESFEIVPDFRFTVKPDKLEVRPGLGVLYKRITDNIQFVNQVKWQIDISKNASCSMMYTAHCLRAIAIQGMSDAGFEIRQLCI